MREILIRSPSGAFAFRVQALHRSEPQPQGRLKRPVHWPSEAQASSSGTLPLTSRARCLVQRAPGAWLVRGARLPSEFGRLACLQ
jgi:hypothetical protein